MESVFTHAAPTPAGHYSQAIVSNELVFVSGQLAIDPVTGEKKLGSIEQQAQQALNNLEAVLKAAGSDKMHVLKTTVYISNIELWNTVNEVYSAFFGSHKPARSVVPTRDLHYGFLIEVEAIATLA
jgi:2-iminobutanoate/2-iminopropanoate deaminase